MCYLSKSLGKSMKLSRLLRHKKTKHSDKKDKSVECFEKKLNFTRKLVHNEQATFLSATPTNEEALLTNCQLAFCIAKTSKPHNIADKICCEVKNNTTAQ